MSIFDYKVQKINIPMKTLGGEVFWNVVDSGGGYTLQQHKITKHYRILNSNNIRVAWSESEGDIRAKFISLSGKNQKPKRGDVIGVHRKGGLYDHYGIYESNDCVYEYAAPNGDFSISQICIHTTSLKKFIGDSKNCFVLVFPEKYGKPGKVELGSPLTSGKVIGSATVLSHNAIAMSMLINELKKMKDYKVYSADETIERAKKRLDEKSYNLVLNNCEHYAIWCKTGIKESHQVNALLRLYSSL